MPNIPSPDQRCAFRRSNDPITSNVPSTALRAYLLDYRQDLRDAIPAPDRYEIEGYEVVEKVAKPSGTTARVWVPKSWEGKRVKIVRLDP